MNSDLGEIPEGWEVESLEMIAQLEKATVKPEDHTTEEFEHFSLPAYDSGQLPALDLGSTIKSNKTLVPSQAVLLSKLNPEIQRVWLPDLGKLVSANHHQRSFSYSRRNHELVARASIRSLTRNPSVISSREW